MVFFRTKLERVNLTFLKFQGEFLISMKLIFFFFNCGNSQQKVIIISGGGAKPFSGKQKVLKSPAKIPH